MIRISTFICALIASVVLSYHPARGDDSLPDTGGGAIEVFVSILPQAYFVERVGGDRVDISVLVGPGQSPATYDPSPREVARLSAADVYFTIGVPFETRLLEKIARLFPDLNLVDTRIGVDLQPIEHHHDSDDHIHEKGTPDPHIWLNPRLVKIQAKTICDELKRLDPQNSNRYEENLNVFHHELDSIDTMIDSLLAPVRGARFYVYHPSYGYFADRYGLKQVVVEAEGKEPGARQLTTLIRQAKADGARAIFVQAQFAAKTAEAIAREADMTIITLDPLSRDYPDNLLDMALKIGQSLSPSPAQSAQGRNHD